MARVTIEMPEHFGYATELPVLIGFINRGDHMANEALVALLNEARGRFMADRGVQEYRASGQLFINADLAVVYRSEARYGETLRIEVAGCDPHKYGCSIVYRVTERDTGRLIAEARTGHLLFDPASGRPVPVTEGFLAPLLTS